MIEHYNKLPASYYRKDHYYDFAPFFECIPKEAEVLSVGCGRGSSLQQYPHGCGVDFNTRLPLLWTALNIADRCELADVSMGLPWASDTFDWTYSTDFFEHLQPDAVAPAVLEVLRVAPNGRHVIDTLQESGFRGPNGENLHPSANNAVFWEAAFKQAGASELTLRLRGRFILLGYGETSK